jgi:hypothetical protein
VKAHKVVSQLLEDDFSKADAKQYLKKIPSPFDVAMEAVEAQMKAALERAADWEQADDLAAEIGSTVAEKHGFMNGSEEFDDLVSFANVMASKAFPDESE